MSGFMEMWDQMGFLAKAIVVDPGRHVGLVHFSDD